MAKNHLKYLQRRRKSWYVRVRVPPSLVRVVGKENIIASLGTRDVEQAKRLRWKKLAEIKERLASYKSRTPTSLLEEARILRDEERGR